MRDNTVRSDKRGRLRLPTVGPEEYYVHSVDPRGVITLTPAYATVVPINLTSDALKRLNRLVENT